MSSTEPGEGMPATSGGDGGRPVERPEVLPVAPERAVEPVDGDELDIDETVDQPAKVMRVGTMLRQLLEEVRSATLDEGSRDRLKAIYEASIDELSAAMSPDLSDELSRLALPFGDDEVPSAVELQIAKAQLVGWLEGLIQGMQASLMAQQMIAQRQLESMAQGQLHAGERSTSGENPDGEGGRPGVYL